MKAQPPLTGVRVVEVAELLPGPFLTHCLVELGAEVIKVERPKGGDPMRSMRPASYDYINRGKRIVHHDLRSKDGVEAVLGLLDDCDVFVEGSRPGSMDRLGLGWETASARNERLVYVSLSGFGRTGPLAQVPGHDLNYQAFAGMLSLTGSADDAPDLASSLPVSDYAGASYALSSTLAALLQRATTGRGQHLDVSITDSIGHWMMPLAAHLRSQGQGTMNEVRSTLQSRPGYATFRCADQQWIAVGALEPHFQRRLSTALGLDESETDRPARQFNEAVGARLAELDCAEALSLMVEHDVPATVVNTPAQYSESDHVRERYGQQASLPGFPVRLDGIAEERA